MTILNNQKSLEIQPLNQGASLQPAYDMVGLGLGSADLPAYLLCYCGNGQLHIATPGMLATSCARLQQAYYSNREAG